MNVVAVCGFGILAAVLCVIIRRINPESALGISICAGVLIMIAAVGTLLPSIDAMNELSEKAGLDAEIVKVLFKALAVCYITTLSADCARDAGETALGTKLEFAGRAAVTVISLPVFMNLAQLVTELLQ